jgi:lysine 2,3-aminomutase
VLIKGVNDSVEVMRALMRALLRAKVRPYYIFHCDPVIGAGHFRTSVWKGLEIMEGLRGHMSGLGVPTYVVDSPHGGGKIPLMPNYLVSASNDAVILRNYEGMLVRYQAEDKPVENEAKVKTSGVGSLLQGDQTFLIPEGSERMARRRKIALEQVANARACNEMAGEADLLSAIPALPIPSLDENSDLEGSDLETELSSPLEVGSR